MRALILSIALLAAGCGAHPQAGANLMEGSVDACELLPETDVQRALATDQPRVDKGTLRETWGSACRWSAGSGAFLSVVAHTKHGAQTFNGLRGHLPGVKDRPDVGDRAWQSGNKIFMLKRGAFVTLEWDGLAPATTDPLARSILTRLDEIAATQAVHRE